MSDSGIKDISVTKWVLFLIYLHSIMTSWLKEAGVGLQPTEHYFTLAVPTFSGSGWGGD